MKKIRTIKYSLEDLSWMPERFRRAIQEEPEFEIKFSRVERNVARKPKRIPVSKWAEKYRVLVKSALPGAWRNSVTPYLVGIMDASIVPCVETIIMCKSPQVGGTEAMHNFVGWTIDIDPGDVLYVFPDDMLAKENMKDRILPMIKSSTRLRSYLTNKDDDETITRINLQHITIHTASARSPAQLGNKPIRYVIFDEIDKYPETAGKKEADPISLGRKRTTTYGYGRKIWEISTPTIEEGPIWKALNEEAQVVFRYHARCPFCGQYHIMIFDQIKWPDDERNPETIEAEELAWYECPLCHEKWDNHLRNKAIRDGEWRGIAPDSVDYDDWRPMDKDAELFEYLKRRRPKKIGFHLPAWVSGFVSLSKVAAAFLRGQRSKVKLKDFMNNYKAEPWLDYTQERKEDYILVLCDDRPAGLVPGDADVLLVGIDTQDRGFYYELRAWQFGPEMNSWLIRAGFVEFFEGLDRVLFESEYLDADGNRYSVRFGFIDSQGHKTADVYDWCRKHRIIKPIRGERRITGAPYKITLIDTYPGTNKKIPGGLQLYRIDTNYYKDILASKLEISPADPGAWHLCSELPAGYAAQMCAEYVDEKTGLWACPEHRPNHYWDCAVYNLAAADVFGVKFLKQKEQKEQIQPKQKKIKKAGVIYNRTRPTWFYNR